MFKCAGVSTLLLLASPALANEPQPLPQPVRAMIEAAIASGNDGDIAAVAKIASQTHPAAAAEIAAMVNAHGQRQESARQERLRTADMLALWSGRGELGGFQSTGSTDEIGISASIALKRQGLRWSHAVKGSADYRRANGATSRERFVASYEPRFQFDPSGFAYGIVQFERDPFIGFDSRCTGSLGIGYKLVQRKKIDLSVDVGPSFRHASYTDGKEEDRVGGRTSLDFAWRATPALTLRQNASAYIESDVASITALTALDARIVSRLSARLSYNVQYETDSIFTVEGLDTLSKVTLIYDF